MSAEGHGNAAAAASKELAPKETVRGLLIDASGTLLRATPSHFLGVDIFPDALRLLGACRRRTLGGVTLRTAVVTNWGHRIIRILESLGIRDCFDAVVSADDVHHAKPHAEIFHFACTELGLEAHACTHLGDSLFDDALGAQAAGLAGVWIHRRADAFMSMHERGMAAQLAHPAFANLEQARAYLETRYAGELL